VLGRLGQAVGSETDPSHVEITKLHGIG
jgi:hypothetical protein